MGKTLSSRDTLFSINVLQLIALAAYCLFVDLPAYLFIITQDHAISLGFKKISKEIPTYIIVIIVILMILQGIAVSEPSSE